MENYYRILGVSENADAEEIRRAYRRLARQHHPDVTGDPECDAFKQVREAYEMLSDRDRRRSYDTRQTRHRHAQPVHSTRHDWFADEVAIDFPSIDNLVERIRQSFFGPDVFALPVSAEILLTPHEAFRGVSVPLDVPVRQTCPLCGGRGEVWMEPCAPCAGSGEASSCYQVQVLVPARVRDGARFRFSVTPTLSPPTFVEVRIAIQ